jgi:hypothetical protein
MPYVMSRFAKSVGIVLVLGGSLLGSALDSAVAQTAPAFAGLSGKWAGDGSIALTNGTTERLRCDANYTVGGGGSDAALSLGCSSDSYKFDLRVSLEDSNGAIVGQWTEANNNVQGGISGRGSKGALQLSVRGQTFNAAVSVTTRGSEQSVKIHADSGNLSQVSITLHHAR